MAFHKYGQTVAFPRDAYVDVHVRTVTLNHDGPADEHVECLEIREFLKTPGVYGHGIVLPCSVVADLKVALDRVVPQKAASNA